MKSYHCDDRRHNCEKPSGKSEVEVWPKKDDWKKLGQDVKKLANEIRKGK
jgi:hypothetical protein